MKTILLAAISTFWMTSACLSDPSPLSLEWKLPDELTRILLEKTGTKSVRTIAKAAYRHTDQFDILAVNAELNNKSDLTGGLVEGIMHVDVAFVMPKNGKLTLYSLNFPIEKVLSGEEIDLTKGFEEFK